MLQVRSLICTKALSIFGIQRDMSIFRSKKKWVVPLDGFDEGCLLGFEEGATVGSRVGSVGVWVGARLGSAEGADEGTFEGCIEGAKDGAREGS